MLPAPWYGGHIEAFVENSAASMNMSTYLRSTKLNRGGCQSVHDTDPNPGLESLLLLLCMSEYMCVYGHSCRGTCVETVEISRVEDFSFPQFPTVFAH